MRVLSDAELREIESIVGRILTTEELIGADAIEALSTKAIEVTTIIAAHSSQLALKYLRELLPHSRLGSLVEFLEHLVSPEAYAFRSPLDLAAMRFRLAAIGPERWRLSDSDTHGDYLSAWIAWPDGDTSRLRIFGSDNERFVLDILSANDELHRKIRCDILPAVEAFDIEEAKGR